MLRVHAARIPRMTCLIMQAFVLLLVSGHANAARAAEDGAREPLQAPYFYVPGDETGIETLPLVRIHAQVDISGVVAQVVLTQEFHNRGTKPIEAVYVMPASTRAAVNALTLRIGERRIEARIEKCAEAKQAYTKAKEAGQTASLLEQQRPNVFEMRVANILPGDIILVDVTYNEILDAEDGQYSFVVPMLVGPRYVGAAGGAEAAESCGESWTANPYLKENEPAPFTFGLVMRLNGGLPVAMVASPTHAVKSTFIDKKSVLITLEQGVEHVRRDFVFHYSLQGKQVETGLLVHKGKDESNFLLLVEPPERAVNAPVLAREYILIQDVSGSMHGFPLQTSRALLRKVMEPLRPIDYVNVLTFAGSDAVLSERSLPATEENKARAEQFFSQNQGGGGTELLPALRHALALPRVPGISRIVIIATDGYVSVEKEAFEIVRQNAGAANVFAFGIGNSVNRFLIEGLARAGLGESFVVMRPDQAEAQAKRLADYVARPLLRDLHVEVDGLSGVELEPATLPDLFAARPLKLIGRFSGDLRGSLTLTGQSATGRYERRFDLAELARESANAALPILWARERVARLADSDRLAASDARAREVEALGLRYHLLTDYTSLVAIDSQVRAKEAAVTVKQPLPLPEGVSNYALGVAQASIGGRGGSGYGVAYGAGMAVRGARHAADAPAAESQMDETRASAELSSGKMSEAVVGGGLAMRKVSTAGGTSLKLAILDAQVPEGWRKALNERRTALKPLVDAYFRAHPKAEKLALTLRLHLDKSGRVMRLDWSGTQVLSASERAQWEGVLGGMQLNPAPLPGKSEVVVMITARKAS